MQTGHVCKEFKCCTCYMLADEPSDDCPIHGYPWPPRCSCGRFVSSDATLLQHRQREHVENVYSAGSNPVSSTTLRGTPQKRSVGVKSVKA